MSATATATFGIAILSVAGMLFRPGRLPEYAFAAGGALLLVACGQFGWDQAVSAAAKGTDVYLFLVGMMLLAEMARREGLFDYLAALAVESAQGSASRLLLIVYGVGTLVTVFLSNDATAVVLTPAVYAAARRARVNPLPYLFACAFVANAASFVLPISNPANLVVYGAAMPPLGTWLAHLGLSALLAIGATYIALRWVLRRELAAESPGGASRPPLSLNGKLVATGLVLAAIALLASSALDRSLGMPTFAAGLVLAIAINALGPDPRAFPARFGATLSAVSWGVIPLVAGLFVLVDAVVGTGTLNALTALLHQEAAPAHLTAAAAGAAVALGSNLVNNLPMGLFAATVGHAAAVPDRVIESVLIGVALGPNFSVTGSLATILWLMALRREGLQVGAWQFLKLGALVAPPALILALAARLLIP